MSVDNYKLAAAIAHERGLQWLKDASNADMSAALDAKLKQMGIGQDCRTAITCLKAIRAYAQRTGAILGGKL